MTRCAACVLVLAAIASAAEGPTRFRKRHTLVLFAKEGEQVAATLHCLAASTGYPDNAAWRLLSPFGRIVAKGVVPVKETRQVRFAAKATGPYTLAVDPGMNAFTIEPSTATWAVDIRDRCLSSNVPFFFKQWGGTNKKKAGRILDGRTWSEKPKASDIRELSYV